MNTHQWAGLFADCWPSGRIKSAADAERWEDELRTGGMNGITDNEACLAVRRLSRTHSGHYSPTLINLRNTMREMRSEAKSADHGNLCALCADKGWLSVAPYLPGDCTPVKFLQSYRCRVPCVCAAGENVMQSRRPYRGQSKAEENDVRRLSRLAAQQNGGIK